MAKGVLLGLLLATCVGLLALAVYRHQSRKPAVEVDPQATGEDNAPSLVAPARPRPALRSAAPAPDHALAPSAPPTATPEPVAPDPGRTHKDIVRDLENAFRSDQPPDNRSAQTAAAIVTAFGEPRAAGAHLNAVDCRATRCKLDIDFSDKQTSNRVLQEMFDMLSSHGVENASNLGFYVASRDSLPNGVINTSVHVFPVERVPPAE